MKKLKNTKLEEFRKVARDINKYATVQLNDDVYVITMPVFHAIHVSQVTDDVFKRTCKELLNDIQSIADNQFSLPVTTESLNDR